MKAKDRFEVAQMISDSKELYVFPCPHCKHHTVALHEPLASYLSSLLSESYRRCITCGNLFKRKQTFEHYVKVDEKLS